MSDPSDDLAKLAAEYPKFLNKGGLSVGLIITKTATLHGLPLDAAQLRTAEGGQVRGLGQSAVQKVLKEFGITDELSKEGGRTSRGSLGLMEKYVSFLNELHARGPIDLEAGMRWWIGKVKLYFARRGPKFSFDAGKSVEVR